ERPSRTRSGHTAYRYPALIRPSGTSPTRRESSGPQAIPTRPSTSVSRTPEAATDHGSHRYVRWASARLLQRGWLADYVLETDGRFQRGTRCVKRHIPGLLTHDAVYCDCAPPLERLYRRLSMRSEITVNPLRGHVPLIRRAVCQDALKAANDITG